MDILLLLFLIAILIGARVYGKGSGNWNYTEIGNTRAISGIFVLMVFLSHASSYLQLGSGDHAYRLFRSAFSQLMVAPFFFYSGYGVFQSVKNQGMRYLRSMPYRRIFRVWYHFAIAVCLYWILIKLYGYRLNPAKIIPVFLGWFSIGNSNWFVFDILVFYVLSWISCLAFRNHLKTAVWVNLGLDILFGIALMMVRPEERHFFNLILIYPAGVLFGYYQESLEQWLKGEKDRYAIALSAAIVLFICIILYRRYLLIYEIHGVLFVAIMVLLSMKVRVGNRFLDFLGSHIFEIYIYQRIPMMILAHYGIVRHHFWYGIVCFGLAAVLAVLMKHLTDCTDRVLRITNNRS